MYDSNGRQIGRVDSERYYDGSGRQIGRVDGSSIYDSSGRQLGRIDGDRVYDGNGRQIGRADGLRRMQMIIYFYFYRVKRKDSLRLKYESKYRNLSPDS
jgi:hypothetical protein